MIPWDIGVVAILIFFDQLGGDYPQWQYWKEALIDAIYEGMNAYAVNAIRRYGIKLTERGILGGSLYA